MNNISHLWLIVLTMSLQSFLFGQTCGDDPTGCTTTHAISFAVHPDASLSDTTIDQALAIGSQILQNCDAPDDVACDVTFSRQGSVDSFGTAGDGLDIVNTEAEKRQILGDNSAFVKVVTASMVGGRVQLGVARLNSNTTFQTSNAGMGGALPVQTLGEAFTHEFGHTRGLHHSSATNNIMLPQIPIGPKVDAMQCQAFHKGGSSNCGVNVAFVIDDTGSMFEEIASVREALTRIINSIDPDAGTVFQLVTFKDNVSVNAPTRDIATILAQVSALRASGGFDCPEAAQLGLQAVKDEVIRAKGTVFIATDADPSDGALLSSLTEELKAGGVTVSTILSSACSPVTGFGETVEGASASSTSSGTDEDVLGLPNDFPYSDNGDPSTLNGSSADLPIGGEFVGTDDLPVRVGAIEAFSFLAEETGGLFAFVPEVNSGTTDGIEKFVNTAFNLIGGGVSNAIVFAEPSEVPAGSILEVTFTSAQPIFFPGVTLDFEDPAIAVLDVTPINSTEILASIAVDPTASTGFKNVTATFSDLDFVIDAVGVGVFRVTGVTTAPTLIGVSPAEGAQGQNLTVTLNGLNTNFDNTSVVTFGSGVQVVNTTVVNSTSLEVEVTIDPTASIGFRTVSISTSGEFVSRPQGFLITRPSCEIIDIVASGAPVCDELTGTYSQAVVVSYENGPTTGTLIVNSQVFALTTSPQTVVLTDLIPNGNPVDVEAGFSDEGACSLIKAGVFTAPATCTVAPDPCEITAIAATGPAICDTASGTYSQAVSITYANKPETGTLEVNGQSFAITSSPQTVTLTGLTPDGSTVGVTASFSADAACSLTESAVFQAPFTCTPLPPGSCGPLPIGWDNQDIGRTRVAGEACFSDGTFTIEASGSDIYRSKDGFHFTYVTLEGDGKIIAQITSVDQSDRSNKVGIMMRESFNRRSKHVFVGQQKGGDALFKVRSKTGGRTTAKRTSAGTPANWLKIVRTGDLFETFLSEDGITYTPYFDANVSMASSIYVGLATTTSRVGKVKTYAFDQVMIEGIHSGKGMPSMRTPAAHGSLSLAVFPNPTKGTLRVQLDEEISQGTVRIMDLQGRVLINRSIDGHSSFNLDLSTLVQGIYQLQLTSAEGVANKQIIKQ